MGYARNKVVRIYSFHNTVAHLILLTRTNRFTYIIHIYPQENISKLLKENDRVTILSHVQYLVCPEGILIRHDMPLEVWNQLQKT